MYTKPSGGILIPFITPDRREKMIAGTLEDIQPGDRCFYHYQKIMQQWKSNPRWTTIDRMLANLFPNDEARAEMLAFLVFFHLHAMPYENDRRAENGDI